MPNLPLHSSSCESSPTLAELERYAQGRMSEAERTSFEETWADDPFLMDAVEGLRHLPDRRRLRKRLHYLRRQSADRVLLRSRQVEARHQRGSRVRPLWWPQAALGIAAALALLLLLGILMPWRNGENPSPEGTTAEAASLPPLETEPLPPVAPTEYPARMAAASEAEAPDPVSPPQPTTSAPPKEKAVMAPVAVDPMQRAETSPSASQLATAEGAQGKAVSSSAVPAPTPEEVKRHMKGAFEEDVLITAPASQSESTAAMALAQPLRAREAPVDTSTAALAKRAAQQALDPAIAKARQAHTQQQWAISRRYAQAVLQQDPSQPEAQYYLGASAYWQGDHEQAIATLSQVSAASSLWYERARWTLAQAYLADQQPGQARVILTTMAASEGRYRAAAQHLLDHME
jgi:hypothetical protein